MQRYLNTFLKLFSVLFSVFLQIFALIWILPYSIKNLFFGSRRKKGKKKSLRIMMRKLLEFKHTRQYIGITLAFLLLFTSIFQVPVASSVQASEEIGEKMVAEIDSIVTEKSYQVPVIGYISQYFTGFHQGIDYAGNYLASIRPAAEGSVVAVEYGYLGYGNNVLVDHGNGLVTRYAHLHTINVTLGQHVDKDTEIGLVGSTGWSTGPHLHFEMMYKGEKINPLSLLE